MEEPKATPCKINVRNERRSNILISIGGVPGDAYAQFLARRKEIVYSSKELIVRRVKKAISPSEKSPFLGHFKCGHCTFHYFSQMELEQHCKTKGHAPKRTDEGSRHSKRVKFNLDNH